MSRLEESTHARLAEIADIFQSGQTELTGRAKRLDTGEIVGRFKGGTKLMYPELRHFSESPGAIAKAIRKGKGRLYEHVEQAVREELSGYIPEVRRRQEKPTIPPHASIRQYCSSCKIFHGKGQHRFHGAGAYLKTHLFPFHDNMRLDHAKRIFAELMKVSRSRPLTSEERIQLKRASATIRADRKAGVMRNRKRLTRSKARLILHEGAIQGRRLTKRQQAFFGARASGYPRPNRLRGKYKKVFRSKVTGLVYPKPLYSMPLTKKKSSKVLYDRGFNDYLAGKPPEFPTSRPYMVGFKKGEAFGSGQWGAYRFGPSRQNRKYKKSPQLVRMGKLVELRYERDHGASPGYYKHKFKSRPTLYYDRSKNTILAR